MSLRDEATNIYLEHGSGADAIALLRQKISEDRSLIDEAMQLAAEDSLWKAQQHVRRRLSTMPATCSEEVQVAVQGGVRRMLGIYDWPMMDGTKLGDATKDDLRDNIRRYEENAAGNLRNSKFLRTVLGRVTGRKTVRQVWNEAELREVMERAKGTAAEEVVAEAGG